MKNSSLYTLALLALVVIIAYNCLYVVKQTERAVLLTFGEVTNFDVPPGLHGKIPGVHVVRTFDGRVQTLAANTESYLTVDRQYLDVDSYVKWRISNVADFYTSTSGNIDIANNLLAQRVNTGLRNQFARRSVHEVVSGERDLLMTELRDELNEIMHTELGIEVVDVRVKKIDLPDQVSESVYQRMNTERYEEAQELRSTGRELAEGIRANADRQRTVIEAEAYRDAETIRGEGDAQATAIYAQAFQKDPEFYEFTRSLNAYRETFRDSSDILLVSPNSDFFKYLNNIDAK
ncbi:MAG: protease modulator HflC [Pseudomonadales bacterium]|nr:protease modulator HflC [Pseudomonadales bacterium]